MATKKIYKIAIYAGHYLETAGKRCLKALDPNETREWVLNDRIVRKIIEGLKEYEGYELYRADDPTGKTYISVEDRCKAINAFGADDCFPIHHNASGVKNFKGGGIVVYVYTTVPDDTLELQKMLYEALIEETGLKGNRSNPLPQSNLAECRLTKMNCVLGELGFMDSPTDVPIILSEEYADACARAYVKVMVKRGNLKKKVVEPPKEEVVAPGEPAPVAPEEAPAEEPKPYVERMKAVAARIGHPFGLKKRGGLSDANHMAAFGAVCVDSLGPTGGGDHSDREFLIIDTIEPHTRFAYELICDLAKE